jgi:hypothetical protein
MFPLPSRIIGLSSEHLPFRGLLTRNILADFLHEALLDFLRDTLRILQINFYIVS